jgi:hypothetical protein
VTKRVDTLQANPTPQDWAGMPTVWWKWLHDVYVLLTCQDGRQNFINTLTDAKVDPLQIGKFFIQDRYGDAHFGEATEDYPYIGPDKELITSRTLIAQERAITNVGAMRVHATSQQASISGTGYVQTYGATDFDQNGTVNLGTGKWTPERAGYYYVIGSVGWGSPVANGTASIAIDKNGATYAGIQGHASTAAYPLVVSVNDILYMNGTTDYAEISIQQDFGVLSNTQGFSYTCFMSAIKIS